jgi:hypothetical protein
LLKDMRHFMREQSTALLGLGIILPSTKHDVAPQGKRSRLHGPRRFSCRGVVMNSNVGQIGAEPRLKLESSGPV